MDSSMKICIIGKYPPIEGGVCATNYWLAHGLAEAGHEVYVVTNAGEVEAAYRMTLEEADRDHLEPRFDSGGFVRLFDSEPLGGGKTTHIPQSNPFVSKLASTATQVIREYGCDVIFGHYFEPYAVAGHLASGWTGTPMVVRHAGSDLDRLSKIPTLATTYKEMLRSAAGVVTRFAERFLGMGVPPERIFTSVRSGFPRRVFHPDAEPLDLQQAIEDRGWNPVAASGRGCPSFDPRRPTLGIYGKVGPVKGSFDLLHALSRLRREGLDFNLVALTQGRGLAQFRAVAGKLPIADRIWVLPFIPHWRIPGFIRACQAVCFLERDFPIKIHTPRVALEVLACGTCLVVSREIADKQVFRDDIENRTHALVVEDPKDHAELADQLRFVISNPERARAIGALGHELCEAPGDYAAFIEGYEELFRQAAGQSSSSLDLVERVAASWREANPQESETARDFAYFAATLERLIPWLKVLVPARQLRPLQRRLFEEFGASEAPVTNPESLFLAALALCDHLAEEPPHADGADRSPPFFADLLRFQCARLEASFDRAEASGMLFDGIDRLPDSFDVRGHAGPLAPRLNRTAQIETFEWNLAPLLHKRLARVTLEPGQVDALIDSVERRNETYVFFKMPNLSLTEMRISPSLVEVLSLCDGVRTTASIADHLAQRAGLGDDGREGFLESFYAALKQLYDRRVVVFAEPARPADREVELVSTLHEQCAKAHED